MYRPDWVVNSVPFKTLNGALKTGFEEFIEDAAPINTFNKVEMYFGNIDVRHHLCRIEGDYLENHYEDLTPACKIINGAGISAAISLVLSILTLVN